VHEVSLVQGALDLAEDLAEQEGATRIHRIVLRIGKLAGVEPEALAFAFEVVTAGTRAEGATLQVESVPVVCRCPRCDNHFEPTDIVFVCPNCGELSAEVCQGTELELAGVEVS
jgi:hydrogenase nickel incorporation protein HypA/HybF